MKMPYQILHPEWNGKIIGLWGAVGVGKDTIQRLLNIPRVAFADALKEELEPICVSHGIDWNNPDHKKKCRELMVALGRVGRAMDPDCWIKRLKLPNVPMVCVTDVRYLNEVEWIYSKGGMVFHIIRDGVEPANDEERRTFEEIEKESKKCGLQIPTIVNPEGDPEYAANVIRQFVFNV
jgi:hypothetical protein